MKANFFLSHRSLLVQKKDGKMLAASVVCALMFVAVKVSAHTKSNFIARLLFIFPSAI